MSLVISVKLQEGFQIGENIFVQLKPDKHGHSNIVSVLIDAPRELKVTRLTNRPKAQAPEVSK